MTKNNTFTIDKIFLFLSILLGCFPLLTFRMRSVLTVIWGVFGVYIFFKQKKKLKYNTEFSIFVTPYLLISLSLFYSTNIENGLGMLTKMLSFVIFPLVFYLNRDFFLKKHIYKIFDFFSISVLILVLFQIGKVVYNYDYISSSLTLQEIKSNGFISITEITPEKVEQIKLRRFRNYIIETSNTHTTYQGLWICFTIFYLGLKSFASEKKVIKIINVVLITIFIFWLYLISARMPFLALVVSLILVIIIFSEFSLKKKVLVSLIPLLVLTALLFFHNPFSTRVKEYYNTGFSILGESSRAGEFNSSNVRNGVYYCDMKLIKDAPFFGVGLGDIQDKLNDCYQENINSKVYKWHTYNTHNQYAFFWIASGVLGLISFLALICINFLNSFKKKNILLFYLSGITTMVFFTENLLQRSDGVLFYFFFISLLFFNKIKK
jgi:O-antigen ligase